MKYSKKFESDYQWFTLKENKERFNFDGKKNYYNKKGVEIIQFDPKGKTAKESFYLYDSRGEIHPTREPNELKALLKIKGSINLNIKMYAEDRAKGILPMILFEEIIKE